MAFSRQGYRFQYRYQFQNCNDVSDCSVQRVMVIRNPEPTQPCVCTYVVCKVETSKNKGLPRNKGLQRIKGLSRNKGLQQKGTSTKGNSKNKELSRNKGLLRI